MTQSLFDKVIDCSVAINKRFTESGALDGVFRTDILTDKEYGSLKYRRAHLSVVDAREQKKLVLLHTTVFPHVNDPSPIYGFDIVCGPTKVSGAFHDFSAAGERNHEMLAWFADQARMLSWNKPRELPDWGKQIFSSSMVAVGAVGAEELDQFIELGLANLDYYLKNVGLSQQSGFDYHMAQNRYCYYQKQNPRAIASLQHLGFTEQEATDYVANKLFPELS